MNNIQNLINFSDLLDKLNSIDYILITINLFLLVSSKIIFSKFYRDDKTKARIRFVLAFSLSLFFAAIQIVEKFTDLIPAERMYTWSFYILTLYFAIFLQSFIHFLSKKYYGKTEVVDGQKIHVDNHQSRMVVIVSNIVIFLLTIYTLIKISGADSLLENTGLIGIVVAVIAFTNGVWFPDLYKGLSTLRSQLLDVGDVVQLNNEKRYYIVRKTTLSYTIFLDIEDNTRVLKYNNVISGRNIKNVSKTASVDGIRHVIRYNIGYPEIKKNADKEERQKIITSYLNLAREMANHAYEACLNNKSIKIKERPFQILVEETGDYAITFALSFHIDNIPKTMVTKTARAYLIETPKFVNEEILKSAFMLGIDLSTPDVVNCTVKKSS